jgi:hypothetical protein
MDTREQIEFPNVPGLDWPDKTIIDIVCVDVELESKMHQDLGIDGLDIPTVRSSQYFDLSKLAGISPYHSKENGIPDPDMCLISVEGMNDFVAEVNIHHMLKVWNFYKQVK